jgi:hypothetical protein
MKLSQPGNLLIFMINLDATGGRKKAFQAETRSFLEVLVKS